MCNCPASRFMVTDIPLLSLNILDDSVEHTPTITDTISAAYPGQNCGGFTVSLEAQTLSSPTLNVADFLTVDPNTGTLTLATSSLDHLGTHTVKMLVSSTGFDQTAVDADGSAGNLPTLHYTFDVEVTMCPLKMTATLRPLDQIAVLGQPSTTGSIFRFKPNHNCVANADL